MQLWLRVLDEESQAEVWKEIEDGYVREDNRELLIPAQDRLPSWVTRPWAKKARAQGKLFSFKSRCQ